jgi:hypothetical protein
VRFLPFGIFKLFLQWHILERHLYVSLLLISMLYCRTDELCPWILETKGQIKANEHRSRFLSEYAIIKIVHGCLLLTNQSLRLIGLSMSFSYMVVISFIDEGNRGTRKKNTNLRKPDYVRKTLICRKSPTSYKTSVVLNTIHHVHESQLYQYVDASPTTIWSQPQQPLQTETTISIFFTDVPCHSSYIRCDGGYKCYNPEVYGPRFCKGI